MDELFQFLPSEAKTLFLTPDDNLAKYLLTPNANSYHRLQSYSLSTSFEYIMSLPSVLFRSSASCTGICYFYKFEKFSTIIS